MRDLLPCLRITHVAWLEQMEPHFQYRSLGHKKSGANHPSLLLHYWGYGGGGGSYPIIVCNRMYLWHDFCSKYGDGCFPPIWAVTPNFTVLIACDGLVLLWCMCGYYKYQVYACSVNSSAIAT